MKKITLLILFLVSGWITLVMGEEKQPNAGIATQVKPRLVVQTGHQKNVNSVAFSPDGRLAISGSNDGTLKLWDVATGKELRTFSGHTDKVNSVAFSPDGRTALSGSQDEALKLWDVATGKELRSFRVHNGAVHFGAFSPDGKTALSASMDPSSPTPILWDVATGKKLRTFSGHKGIVTTATFSANGRFVVSGSWDTTLKLWDIETGKELRTFSGHTGSVKSVAFSPDGRFVISGSSDKTARLWDVATGKQVWSFLGHKSDVKSVAFPPDGLTVISAGSVGLKLWDPTTGKELPNFSGHTDNVNSVAFSPDGRFALSGGSTMKLWEVETGKELRGFSGHGTEVRSVAFSPDDRLIMSGGDTMKLWDLTTGRELRSFRGHTDWVESVAFSPDGQIALSGGMDPTPKLWDVTTGKELRTFNGHKDTVTTMIFSADGRFALSGSWDRTLKLWDVSTGKELRTLVGHAGGVKSIAFSPDGHTAVSGDLFGLKLWDVAMGKELPSLRGHSVAIGSLAYSPDGRFILSGGGSTLKLWDVTTGEELRKFSGHESNVTSVAFSPNGRTALSGSYDKTLKLWDVATGKELRSFVGHTDEVKSVAFSPNGRTALSGGGSSTVLWEIASGKWLAKLYSFTDGTWAVVDPEGRFDTNNLEEIKGLHWVMPDAPFTPLPLEIFMHQYYEPRLLPRILNCDSFQSVPDLMSLNRVQPRVAISTIKRDGEGDTVTVRVEVAKGKRIIQGAPRQSGAKDVKLFRDGQLVGFRKGRIELDQTGKAVPTFSGIRLPRTGAKEVEFSAYAFNENDIKSSTSRQKYVIPADLTPRRGKAYIVTVGVNRHQNPSWDLLFAANDAVKICEILSSRIIKEGNYSEAISISLTDAQATKEHIRAIFAVLAGEGVPSLLKGIPNADRLAKATPEDLLIISFSGHGHVDKNGTFYTFTHDTGPGSDKKISSALLKNIVSSDEFSEWIRYVDAGQMALIVDACHSAATVGKGFKAGPMGSRGLGQLAYDKGMRILAASQADDVALETDRLQHGLLTYALIHDGIGAFQADFKPKDQAITLAEWLTYGTDRVPKLYEEVKANAVSTLGRTDASRTTVVLIGDAKSPSLNKERAPQQPSLFDFTGGKRDTQLTRQGDGGK